MGRSIAQQLIESHLAEGRPETGSEIGLSIEQTLTQDATGTTVMLELEAMGLDRVQTAVSVQYVDHNLLQADERNSDDHLFLRSACRRFGLWYSRAGNGVSHPVHMERFGIPGASMAGSDSHTCAAGALGMLAIGTGGLEVALAMAGEPLRIVMPQIWGIELTGELPPWVSAKDVILEMLRRHGVKGGVNKIIEYHGPGLAGLDAMDRHVIANMGAELGATTTVFPADEAVRQFLTAQGRADDYRPVAAEEHPRYDLEDQIDLSRLEPLIARPHSPGNVVPVAEAEGEDVFQVVVGSSANPGLRDFAAVAEIVAGRRSHDQVSLDINPTSAQVLGELSRGGWLLSLVSAGARIHQSGCLGCIGMGQAPGTGRNSLRTVPRNFPGRSGSSDDAVWLCSPETAAAAALTGKITDPRRLPALLGITCPVPDLPRQYRAHASMLMPPLPADEARREQLVKGPNIVSLPRFGPPPEVLEAAVALKLGDDVSTDEIMPAGARVLPLRSNIPAISEFAFTPVDPDYPGRAQELKDQGGHIVVAGGNYGQGSSREHAAIAPRYLGLQAVLARSFARIHWQNLVNFGIIPLEFADPADYDRVKQGDTVCLRRWREELPVGSVQADDLTQGFGFELIHHLSTRQVELVLAGGQIARLGQAAS
jgi:aconitate hydratase